MPSYNKNIPCLADRGCFAICVISWFGYRRGGSRVVYPREEKKKTGAW